MPGLSCLNLDSAIHGTNHFGWIGIILGKPFFVTLSTGQTFIQWIALSTFWTTGAWWAQWTSEKSIKADKKVRPNLIESHQKSIFIEVSIDLCKVSNSDGQFEILLVM